MPAEVGRATATGEMARRIAEFDWSETDLGAMDAWPQSLRHAVQIILDSPQMATLVVGDSRLFLYNDLAIPHYGDQHPAALGAPIHDTFGAAYYGVDHYYVRAFAGESIQVFAEPLDPGGTGKEELFDTALLPIRGEDGTPIAVLSTGVSATERLRSERSAQESREQTAFLLRLSDALRSLDDPDDIAKTATRLLRTALAANRSFLGIVAPDGHTVDLGAVFAHGVEEASGLYSLRSFAPPLAQEWHAGRVAIVTDVDEDDRFGDAERAAFASVATRAVVVAPLIREGRLVAILGLSSKTPRVWTDDEITVVAEAAERTWAATRRANAEAALRDSEERQRFLLELSDRIREEDADATLSIAAAMLGRKLGASSVAFRDIDAGRGIATVREGWGPGDRSFVPASFQLSSLGDAALRDLRDGRTVRVDHDGPEDDQDHDVPKGGGAQAAIVVPLLARDELVLTLDVNQDSARQWTDAEIGLTEAVAQRAWEAVKRARAEAGHRHSENLFRQFGDATGDILWIRDAEKLQWTYLTPAFERIYGMSRDEACAGDDFAGWIEHVVPEHRARVRRKIEQVRDGEPVTFDYRIRHHGDGNTRWLRTIAFPIPNEDGDIAFVGGVEHDLSDLREMELRHTTLVEGIPQLVWRAKDVGQWTWANPQWIEHTGQRHDDYVHEGWLDVVHPEDRDIVLQAWNEAREKGGFDVEYRIIHAASDTYRWFHTRASPVRDSSGAIVEWLGTSTDIDDLRRLQESQRTLLSELQHRVRNMLGLFRALVRGSTEWYDDVEDYVAHLVGRINAMARTQVMLTRDSRLRLDLETIVQDELQIYSREYSNLEVEGPGVLLSAKAAEAMTLAIHELATNSMKYGVLMLGGSLSISWETYDRGGEIWVELKWRERSKSTPDGPMRDGPGFGTELIEQRVPYELGGECTLNIDGKNVDARIAFPLRDGSSIFETAPELEG